MARHVASARSPPRAPDPSSTPSPSSYDRARPPPRGGLVDSRGTPPRHPAAKPSPTPIPLASPGTSPSAPRQLAPTAPSAIATMRTSVGTRTRRPPTDRHPLRRPRRSSSTAPPSSPNTGSKPQRRYLPSGQPQGGTRRRPSERRTSPSRPTSEMSRQKHPPPHGAGFTHQKGFASGDDRLHAEAGDVGQVDADSGPAPLVSPPRGWGQGRRPPPCGAEQRGVARLAGCDQRPGARRRRSSLRGCRRPARPLTTPHGTFSPSSGRSPPRSSTLAGPGDTDPSARRSCARLR